MEKQQRGSLRREVILVITGVITGIVAAVIASAVTDVFDSRRMVNQHQMALTADALDDFASAWADKVISDAKKSARYSAKIRLAAFGSKEMVEAVCELEGTLRSASPNASLSQRHQALADLIAKSRTRLSLDPVDSRVLFALMSGRCGEWMQWMSQP